MTASLSSVLQGNNLSMTGAAALLGINKAVISRIISRTYPGWEAKEKELVTALAEHGYTKTSADLLQVRPDAFVKTASVSRFFALADSLSDPRSSLTSSLGMVIGAAEMGKTFAAKKYAERNEQAVYTLYVDGYSRCQLLRNICFALAGTRPATFGRCVSIIAEFARISRRLIIVDEADKCPLRLLEMLRGINEACSIPILFVGEEALKGKIDAVPRLRSRIRKPVCVFEPLTVSDVSVYYSTACGLLLEPYLTETLFRRSRGGFRTLANESLALADSARISGLSTITPAMIDKLGA